MWERQGVGARLARDGSNGVLQENRVASIASKPAPTGECQIRERQGVGAWLARDGSNGVLQENRVATIASKPAPTGECQIRERQGVGAGLPAMAATGSCRKTALPLSRASPLPQGRGTVVTPARYPPATQYWSWPPGNGPSSGRRQSIPGSLHPGTPARHPSPVTTSG